MTSSTETRPEPIVLIETAPNSGRFAGMIAVAPAPATADGVLQVADGDLVTGTYRDADDGTGAAVVTHATTVLPIECAGPTITGVRADDVSAGRVRISWVTDEPANSRVDWGLTSALGTTVLDNALVTDHQLVITGLDLCGDYFFRVRSEDERGYGSVDDRGGLRDSLDCIPSLHRWKYALRIPLYALLILKRLATAVPVRVMVAPGKFSPAG